MPDMIRVTPTIEIDEDELVEAFVRASGPGGQNVNKVASAVELRFNVDRTESLTAAIKSRLRRIAGRRLNLEGWIVLKADRYRSQERNRSDARERLVAMIAEAAVPPRPRIKYLQSVLKIQAYRRRDVAAMLATAVVRRVTARPGFGESPFVVPHVVAPSDPRRPRAPFEPFSNRPGASVPTRAARGR